MSKNLMDTEPGGEQTQYEGIHTFVEPHSKQAGQLGGKGPLPPLFASPFSAFPLPPAIPMHADPTPPPSMQPTQHTLTPNPPSTDPATGTTTELDKAASNAPNTQGVTPAEKMRYGQAISEGGMGGKTMEATGDAATAGGFGGTDALEEQGEGFVKQRREQGYGGERDMRRDVGA